MPPVTGPESCDAGAGKAKGKARAKGKGKARADAGAGAGAGAGGGAGDERMATARAMTETMKAAMSRPQAPPMEPDEIMRVVAEMQGDPGDPRARAQRFGARYPGFMEQCPALFQKACRPGLDMNMLRFMVSAMREHPDDEGSEMVGARLADTFVRDRRQKT